MENNEIIERTAEVATTVAEQVTKPSYLKETCKVIAGIVPIGIGVMTGMAIAAGIGHVGCKVATNLVTKLRNRKAKKEDRKKSKNNDDNVDVGEMPETIDE
jgi:hypothetical protein